jgi:hypothetical protein
MDEKTPTKNEKGDFFTNLFRWRVDKETLKRELSNYDNFCSAKNVAAIFVAFFGGVFGLLFNAYSVIHWINFIFYIVFALLIFLGLRWTIILIMVIWTVDGGMNIIDHLLSGDTWKVMWTGIWWAMGMKLMWRAFCVEMFRKKKINDKNNTERKGSLQGIIASKDSSERQSSEKNKGYFVDKNQTNYCSQCGYKLEKNSNFCSGCGAEK